MINVNVCTSFQYAYTSTIYESMVQFILATPVQFIIGWQFYVGAINLRNGGANMDVLFALVQVQHIFTSIYEMVRWRTA